MTHEKTRKPQKSLIVHVCLAALIAVIAIGCGKITTASEDLIGVWKSSDIQYSDTSFEIQKNAITFRNKEGNRNSYGIIEIKKKMMEDRNWVLYTIYYMNRDMQKVEFPFYFQMSNSGLIRFKNQPSLVWKKDSGITT
ncbi:MAG: hypothetical protein JSV17_00475 [Candidatus Aminicenantes bacterium]|nr:MAG: hypothetical protein JSV17_00475 [Candidatus Aminicenantes bacterium]